MYVFGHFPWQADSEMDLHVQRRECECILLRINVSGQGLVGAGFAEGAGEVVSFLAGKSLHAWKPGVWVFVRGISLTDCIYVDFLWAGAVTLAEVVLLRKRKFPG